MNWNHSFSCQDFLEMNSVAGALLLSGEHSLESEILRANVVENKNICDWISSGDMVITSGYSFKDSNDSITALLPTLKNAGVVGLCIKPQHYINDIPDTIIQKAREIDFPLIQLPLKCIFSNIVHEVIEKILIKKSDAFRQEQKCIESLLNSISQSEDILKTLDTIESLLQNPVIMLNTEGELVSTDQTQHRFSYLQSPSKFMALCRHTYSGQGIFPSSRGPIPVYIVPIEINPNTASYLFLLEVNRKIEPADSSTLSQISKILALELRNKEALKQIRAKYKNKFIQEWILGNLGDETDICMAGNATGYQMNPEDTYIVGLLNLPDDLESSSASRFSHLSRIIRRVDHSLMFTFYKGQMVILSRIPSGTKINPDMFRPIMTHLKSALNNTKLCLYISESCRTQYVPSAYQEVLKIYHIGQKCNLPQTIITRQDLGIFSLLALLPDTASVTDYKDQFLRPIRQYDSKHNTQLLKTLKCYLSQNCNKKITAQKLFTHYNTVTYRLGQIEELLNLSLDSSDSRLQVEIALKLELIQKI